MLTLGVLLERKTPRRTGISLSPPETSAARKQGREISIIKTTNLTNKVMFETATWYWSEQCHDKKKRIRTSMFLFLLIILSSVRVSSTTREWFKCSSQRFVRSTCQESWRTYAAGNTQHCEEKQSNTITPKLGLARKTHDKSPQEPHK